MNDKREIKKQCYLEVLEDHVVGVEMILNHISKLKESEKIFDESIIQHDRMRAIMDLELALATLCILLRKMAENLLTCFSAEMRRDINSIIHSNRFEFDDLNVVVYSQKGKEIVDLNGLLDFCHTLLESDNVFD